jgi:hypothetical protein
LYKGNICSTHQNIKVSTAITIAKNKIKKTSFTHTAKASITRENFTKDFQQEPKRRTYLLLTKKSKPSQPSQLQKPVAQFIEDKKETSKSQKKDLDVPNLYVCVCV